MKIMTTANENPKNSTNFQVRKRTVSEEFRAELCEISAFPQNLHIRKLG